MIDELLPQLDQMPPLDLEQSTLEALCYLCLAQAQESFWLKAKSEDLKNGLVAKLSIQVSEYYSQALDFSNRTSSIRSEWIQHFTCKKYHFKAAAHYRAALDSLDKGKYGEEIGHLKDSLEASSIALSNAKYVSDSVLEDIKELNSRVKSDLVGAEKDNDMIYLQTVPTSASLPVIPPIVMAKATIPEEITDPIGYLENTLHTKPLFADILPYTVYEASNAYTEKMNEYVQKNLISKIEEMTVNMHSSLQAMNLPGSLEAVEKPMGVPQNLILHSDDIRTKGGVSLLRGSINDIQKLFRESKHLLEEGKQMLEYEEEEDSMMRNKQGTDRWVRSPSREAGDTLWKAATTIQGYLDSSDASDKLVRAKFHKVEGSLDILCEGPKRLESYIPNSAVVHVDPYLEYTVQELREALLQTRGIEDQRHRYISGLMHTVATTDMLPDIIKAYTTLVKSNEVHTHVDAAKFEPVYTAQIKKLQDENAEWMAKQEADQTAILSKIEQLNTQFLEFRESDSTTIDRENAIQNLEVAYFKFGEIMQNLDEGRKFYNSLIEQLRSFVDQCKEFVYQRRIEGRELENHINDSFAKMSISESSNNRTEQESQNRHTAQNARQSSATPSAASPPSTPIAAPQARHPAMVSRVWQPTDSIKFAPSPSSSSSSKPTPNNSRQTWQADYGIKFSGNSGSS